MHRGVVTKVPQQLKEAYAAAKAADWDVIHRGDNHLLWTSPDGSGRVSTPSSDIGCSRTVKNYLRQLVRAGLDIPSAGGRHKGKKQRP